MADTQESISPEEISTYDSNQSDLEQRIIQHVITLDDYPIMNTTAENIVFVNGKSGTAVTFEAKDIEYSPGRSLKEVIDELISGSINITLNGGGLYEQGQQVVNAQLSWTIEGEIISQSINNGIGSLDPSLRQYTIAGPIMNDTTYTITVNSETSTSSASVAFKFLTRNYWGVSEKEELTESDVKALESELLETRRKCFDFNCSGGKYFYIAIPKAKCDNIIFKVGSMIFSDMNVSEVSITNEQGVEIVYNIYRPNNIQTGDSIKVQVL